MPNVIQLTHLYWESMRRHVQSCLEEEACGLLGGDKGEVRMVIAVSNSLHSPVRFRMDPEGQLAAMHAIEEAGLELLGIYHSHPQGPPGLSETDLEEMSYPELAYLIWSPSGGHWTCRAYRLEAGQVVEIGLQVSGS